MIFKPYITYEEVIDIAKEHESSVFKIPSRAMVDLSKNYAAFINGKAVAYVLLQKEYEPRLYSIPSLATRKGFERKRIMKELLINIFLFSGAKKIWLEVHQDNVGARSLYKELGFIEEVSRGATYEDGTPMILCEVVLEN